MTAVLDKDLTPDVGSMTPRLFTPPLEHHCTGPAADPYLDNPELEECPCGCGLNPVTSWGFACNHFAKNVLKWKLLPYQKWLNIHALEKDDKTGGFRFKILIVLIARQQGKTHWLKCVGLWRLFVNSEGRPLRHSPGAKLAIIAAQNLQYAEGVLKDVVDQIRDNQGLGKELINHRVTNGNHRAILTNRRYWRAATASRKGGRSLSVDVAMLDELREHVTSDAWDAIVPTTLVRPFSQVICTSNAGDHRSEVLRSLRDAAMRRITTNETGDTKTALFEWSVPMEVDPAEERYWHMANPALGHLNDFSLVDLRAMFEAEQYRNMPGFQTEHLALDVDTPILTTDGWKTMETIAVGDQVFHPGGHPIDVTHITPIYTNRDCYEVQTTDGRTVVCDAEHQWLVNDRRSNRGWETLNTSKLISLGLARNKGGGGRYSFRLPNQLAIISKPVDLPINPYLLGAWLGDGTAGKAEITCAEAEADELTRCRELGIWTNKHIPDLYLTAGTEQRLALMQGLCDTDGSIDANNGRVRFCSVRKRLAEQVLYLARSLGWRATLTAGISRYGATICGPAYCVSWTHDAAEPPPFRLRRKVARIQARPSRAGERTAISIRSITPVISRPVRCITVGSADSLWLAGSDLLPTRNCQWVDALEPGIIPAEHWAETRVKVSRRAEGSPVYAALDVNYERSRSFIAIAARREDGNVHTEVINGARGTDWVIPWLSGSDANGVDRRKKFAGVAVQKTGAPASGMIDDMRRAGIPVVEWGPGIEVAGGTGAFYDGIVEHRILHKPALVLDRAAASGISRNVGEGWVFDRRNSPVDVSPLIACAAAVWLEHQPPASAPDIHEWPSDEVLAAWEAEAEDFPTFNPAPTTLDDIEGNTWWTR